MFFCVRVSTARTEKTGGPSFGLTLLFSCVVSPTRCGDRVGARTAPVEFCVRPPRFSLVASMVSGYIRPLPDLGGRAGCLRRLRYQTLHKPLATKFTCQMRGSSWGEAVREPKKGGVRPLAHNPSVLRDHETLPVGFQWGLANRVRATTIPQGPFRVSTFSS